MARRTFGNTWWGKQWLDALSYVDHENRLARGRSYYNTGHVESCEWIESEQRIEAFVSGSAYYPYQINIELPKWGKQKEKQLLDAIAADPTLVGELLEGTLSPTVADICHTLKLDLFPNSWRAMHTHCSCPDSARICKHIAAVFYCLADLIDINPFLIFKLHGLDLQAELKARGVDLSSATSAHAITAAELAQAAMENKPDPDPLQPESALSKCRSLAYNTLEPMRKTILSLLPEKLNAPGEQNFRASFDKLFAYTERAVAKLQAGPITVQHWIEQYVFNYFISNRIQVPEVEAIQRGRVAVEMKINVASGPVLNLHLTWRDADGKKRTATITDTNYAVETLLQMPREWVQDQPPEVECWHEIAVFSARLLRTTSIVPALVLRQDKKVSLPRLLWTPAVRNRHVAQLLETLTQACTAFSSPLFKHCLENNQPGTLREYVFLAVSVCASGLFGSVTLESNLVSTLKSVSAALAMQAPGQYFGNIPASYEKALLRGFRAFLLGNVYPWRPVLAARLHQDGIKLNYGILGREIDPVQAEKEELAVNSESEQTEVLPAISPKRPVMLSRVLKEERFQNERFAAMSVLKTLTDACPALSFIAETKGRPVTLERSDLKDFLFDAAPVLTLLGVAVMLPSKLKALLRPRLVAHLDAGKGKSFLGKDAFTDFNWRLAVGNRELTDEDLARLVEHAGEIVRIGDDFVYIDPDELARLAETVQKQPQPTYLEKMRAALMGEYEKGALKADVFVSNEVRERMQKLTAVNDITPPENLNATLRPYQARGFSWLMKNLRLGIGALIADDMGLGKTLQVIATLLQLKNDGELNKSKVLAVVPTTLMTNWTREIAKFAPSLTVGLYHGADRTLPESEKELPDVTLTSYGLMRRDTEKLASYKWRLLVLDEAQAIKNASSGQSVAAKSIRAAQTIAMTGTPVENRLSEYWSILDTVQPRLLGSARDFSNTFANPIENDHNAEAAEAFRRLTAPFMLRRLKSDKSIIADLPERNSIDQFTTLTVEQAALYSKVLEQHIKKLSKLEEDTANDPSSKDSKMARRGLVLKLITHLKQICNSPSQYLKTETPTPDSGKAAALFDILERCREAQRKVLIFTQYREMGEKLQQWIEQATGEFPDFLHGAVPVKARQTMVDRFQTDRSVHTMIISLKAGGTGLNLTAASCVIHYDLWWNPAVEAQATDRAYRIGQLRDVLVYRFVTAGTFEERINDMLEQKRGLADMTVATGETWIGDLPTAELKALFSLDEKTAHNS